MFKGFNWSAKNADSKASSKQYFRDNKDDIFKVRIKRNWKEVERIGV